MKRFDCSACGAPLLAPGASELFVKCTYCNTVYELDRRATRSHVVPGTGPVTNDYTSVRLQEYFSSMSSGAPIAWGSTGAAVW